MEEQKSASDRESSEKQTSDVPTTFGHGQVSTYIKPQARAVHDSSVTFEEYYFYAQKTREEEKTLESPVLNWREIVLRKKTAHPDAPATENHLTANNFVDRAHRSEITDEEWTDASRAYRTASWGACFYLITTDILGPYGVGFSLGTLGWGPGIALYTVFGFMAGYSGYLIWHVFLGVDSYEFPARNYGDLGFRTWGNMISLIAALIAAGLYGNIGIKVLYNNILVDIFSAPPLITSRGKLIYAAIVPIWWALAFVIAAAIPDYFGFISVIAASCLLNLTYTLPPFFALGFDIQRHAMKTRDGHGFDPVTGETYRDEETVRRWIRGFVSGGPFQVVKNVWHVVYFLASLSMCGLGMYAAVEGLIDAFKIPQLTSFSCTSPLNLHA